MANLDATTSDSALINAFLHGSEEAFARLVDRYLPVVYAAARRQVSDSPTAEDVTQAVFMILAKKAKLVRSQAVLAAWLLRVTRYCALDARKLELRRGHHEQEAAKMKAELSSGQEGQGAAVMELAPFLDEAILKLGAVERNALVLHYFQNQTLEQTGVRLGLSKDATHQRVMRAVGKLRRILKGKGLTLSLVGAGGLGTMLASSSLAAVPPATLVAGTIANTAVTAAAGTLHTGTAIALTKGALHTMAMIKLKLMVGLAALGILLAGTGGLVVHHLVKQDSVQVVVPEPVVADEPTATTTTSATAPTTRSAEELLRDLKQGYTENVTVLTDIELMVEVHGPGEKGLPTVSALQYLAKNGKERVTSYLGPVATFDPTANTLDFLISDGTHLYSWNTGRDSHTTVGRGGRSRNSRRIMQYGMGPAGLFGLDSDPVDSPCSVNDLFENPSLEVDPLPITIDKLTAYKMRAEVIINRVPYKVSYWICPERGCLAIKGEVRSLNGELSRTFQAEEFRQLENGKWLPQKATWLSPHDAEHLGIMLLKKVQLQPTIDEAKVFDMDPNHLPVGTYFTDLETDKGTLIGKQ